MTLALALSGAFVCGTLLAAHGGGWRTDSEPGGLFTSLCNSPRMPSATCAEALDGRWGAVDFALGGRIYLVPTSFVGLAYFASIAVWLMVAGVPPNSARWTWRFILSIGGCGGAASLFFVGLMIFALETWCPLCVMAHVFNAGVLVGVVWVRLNQLAAPASNDSWNTDFSTGTVPQVGFVPALAIAGAATVGMWLYYDATTVAKRYFRENASLASVVREVEHDAAYLLRQYYAQPVVDLPSFQALIGGGDASLGPRLVVFTDYRCSSCACFNWRLGGIIEPAFRGRLLTQHRQVGGIAKGRRQTRAAKAGLAAEAAREQGGDEAYAKMRDLLFRHRRTFPEPDYVELARKIGLDPARLLADMEGDVVRDRIAGDIALAKKLGIDEAPAVFLNNRRVPNLCIRSEVFWDAVAPKILAEAEFRRVEPDLESIACVAKDGVE